MSTLNLIMSGAYVGQELAVEFGKLPPAFLPVGVGRLYDLQIELLRKVIGSDEVIHITLPESFSVSLYDRENLDKRNVSLLFVPDDTTLGEAVIYAINMLAAGPVSVRVMNGDTVFDNLPITFDTVAVHEDSDDYSWAGVNYEGDRVQSLFQIPASSEDEVVSSVACGFFAFSSSISLIRSVILAKYNFIEALNSYNEMHQLSVSFVEKWYDFGHLQTYFHSRRLVTTVRSFNSMKITHDTVEKSSNDHFKMNAEVNWLSQLPSSLQPYAVRVYDHGILNSDEKSFYSTEYQYAPNLAELFVFSKLGQLTWKKILLSCKTFLEKMVDHTVAKKRDTYLSHLIREKTRERMETYASRTGFDLDRNLIMNGQIFPSIRHIVTELQGVIGGDSDASASIMHGDFCFSNILYNSRNQRISVIDPRGYVFKDIPEIYGDIRYDMAKLSHSINGFYDLILAGRYSLDVNSPYDMALKFEESPTRDWLKGSFSQMMIAGISTKSLEIQAITILLFVSMLPLHSDRPDRQRAFIANALRLYTEFKEDK